MLTEVVDHILEEKLSFPKLRAIPYGGSTISTEVLVRASEVFPGTLIQFYGLAEALAPISCLSSKDHDGPAAVLRSNVDHAEIVRAFQILGSAGKPVSGIEIKICGSNAIPFTEDQQVDGTGEVLIRGHTVMHGYWNRPSLTAQVLDSEGWFSSGDIGELDNEGFLHILGRQNDVIISGGFNVYPSEVEKAIGVVAGLKEIAVVGAPHPRWGEAVHAFVVRNSDHERGQGVDVGAIVELQEEMLKACKDRLASYKKPIAFHFLTALPRNAAGKIDRKQLRQSLVENG
jgi:acyl-CoA synthetase (AMP-forming)/AMP-acid ligase II